MDDDASSAPFGPPATPVEVQCLHCGQTFSSAQIVLRHDAILGEMAWCCPTPGCDAAGFGFDLLPTDPAYRDERGGWSGGEDDEEGDDEDDLFDEFGDLIAEDEPALPPADEPDDLPTNDVDRAADRRRRLFGDEFKGDDIPF